MLDYKVHMLDMLDKSFKLHHLTEGFVAKRPRFARVVQGCVNNRANAVRGESSESFLRHHQSAPLNPWPVLVDFEDIV